MADDLYVAAKQYVDTQLATMRRYGSAPELSEAEYDGLVADVAAVTHRLRRRYRADKALAKAREKS